MFGCIYTCYCVNMVSVTSASRYIMSASRDITSASRYHPRYQSRFSMYIRGLIPRNFAELAEAIPIGKIACPPCTLIGVSQHTQEPFAHSFPICLQTHCLLHVLLMFSFGKLSKLKQNVLIRGLVKNNCALPHYILASHCRQEM